MISQSRFSSSANLYASITSSILSLMNRTASLNRPGKYKRIPAPLKLNPDLAWNKKTIKDITKGSSGNKIFAKASEVK